MGTIERIIFRKFALYSIIFMINNLSITSPSELVTSREQTRAGFINFALKKNELSTPFVNEAKTLKVLASRANNPKELIAIKEIRSGLITAAGLSDKSLVYLTEADVLNAINNLVDKFLEPEGKYFVDALVYRYLLIRGDTLGGSMRNYVGAFAQQKLIRTLISNLHIMGVPFLWAEDSKQKEWTQGVTTDDVECKAKFIYWQHEGHDHLLGFNLNIPVVKKNVDICLFDAKPIDIEDKDFLKKNEKFLMLGELKGGIDPAGADEHWKTGNTALDRIRKAFLDAGLPNIPTSFVAAAIEKSMAEEIFEQICNNTLSYATNLTIDEQLVNYCEWIIKF